MSPEMMLYVIDAYERQLQKLMGHKKFKRFANEVAKEAFLHEIDSMRNADFKDFVFNNLDDITDDSTSSEDSEK